MVPRFRAWFGAYQTVEIEAESVKEAIKLAKEKVDETPADWEFQEIDDLDELEKEQF